MKNTLRFSLILIGLVMIGLGLYLLLFPESVIENYLSREKDQYYAMIGFGFLSLLAGMAYKRK